MRVAAQALGLGDVAAVEERDDGDQHEDLGQVLHEHEPGGAAEQRQAPARYQARQEQVEGADLDDQEAPEGDRVGQASGGVVVPEAELAQHVLVEQGDPLRQPVEARLRAAQHGIAVDLPQPVAKPANRRHHQGDQDQARQQLLCRYHEPPTRVLGAGC